MVWRDKERDNIFERLYEDNISGEITDDRFIKMSAKYESEQGELAKRIKAIKRILKNEHVHQTSADSFIEIVRRYYYNYRQLFYGLLLYRAISF